MSSSDSETKPLMHKTTKRKLSNDSDNEIPYCKPYLIPIFVLVGIVLCIVFWKVSQIEIHPSPSIVETPTSVEHDQNWEFLLFTQQWPISYCTSWTEENNLPVTACHFSENKFAWNVHGIWPTLNSTAYPQFCRRIPFNESDIESIEDDLRKHWSTIQKGNGTRFWKHEWLKHGTCSVQIPQLDTELKYFMQGLVWNKKFNITDAFLSCQIVPDDAQVYESTRIVDCLGQYFGVTPQIDCVRDKIREKDILVEIRFCVNKEMDFVGCDNYGLNNLCEEKVIYPATVTLPEATKTKTD